jgi:predicted PurR-regulated permease PerM
VTDEPKQRDARWTIDIAPAAIAKVIAGIALVWLWLHLWQLLMLVIVALVVAIGLDPLVEWLQRRRVPRALAATAPVVVLTVLVVGFFWITGSVLASQAKDLSGRMGEIRHALAVRVPAPWRGAILRSGIPVDAATVAGYLVDAGRLLVSGAIIGILALILTIYLLIEGRQTYAWLVAYAPPAYRDRVHVTAAEAQKAIYGYVVGNVATSLFATVVVFIALTLLHVPAALLLAVLAGVCDFVPVLGFIFSSVPAVLLGLSVSPAAGLAVAGVYAAYHLAENYYIGPKVYGDRLKLSNIAVILAFAVGAEIGGVGGALLALPLAALYPVIERVWLKDYLARDAVATHGRLQNDPSQ